MREAALTLVVLAQAGLLAQAPAVPPPPPFREGTAEASFVGTTGNSSTQSIGVGAEFIMRPDPWETRVKLGLVRNEVGGVASAQAFNVLARGQRKFFGNAAFFAQYTFLSDKFAGTNSRHTGDVGIAGPVFQGAKHSLTADVGGGYATDQRTAGTGKSTAIASAGAIYKWKISETADFTEDSRFVGAVPDGADWRLTNVASVAAKISTGLSLKVSNTIRHVNVPVTGFLKTDVQTSVALVAKF
jgi:putative salt-induced outer membrane protein YdiY